MANPRKKSDVIRIMRRIGIAPETIARAEHSLPDPVDLDHDGDLLVRYGVTTDTVWRELGGSV
jgi:hypothetical protein